MLEHGSRLALALLCLCMGCARSPDSAQPNAAQPDRPEAAQPASPERQAAAPAPLSCDPALTLWEGDLCRSTSALEDGELDLAARSFARGVDGVVRLEPDDPRVMTVVDLSRRITNRVLRERGAPAAVDFLVAARRSGEQAGGDSHIITAYLYYELATVLESMGNHVAAEIACQEAEKRAEATFGPSDSLAIRSSILRARILLFSGQADEAAKIGERAARLSKETFRGDNVDYLDASILLVQVHQHHGRSAEALALIEEVDDACRTRYGAGYFGCNVGLAIKARLLQLAYRHEEAIAAATEVVELFDASQAPVDRMLAGSYATMATSAYSLGWMDKAYLWAKAALGAVRALPARTHDETVEALNRLVKISIDAGRSQEAEAYHLRVGRVMQQMNVSSDTSRALFLAFSGEIAAQEQRDDQADAAFSEALEIFRKTESPLLRTVPDVHIRFATYRSSRARWKEAEALIEEAFEVDTQEKDFRGPFHVRGLYVRAVVQHRLGNHDLAEQHYERALSVGQELLGERSLHLIPILDSYSQLLAATDRSERADALAAEARALRELRLALSPAPFVAGSEGGSGRYEFPSFHFACELPRHWVAFDPEAMLLGGQIGFTWRQQGVRAIVKAAEYSDRPDVSNDELMAVVSKVMEARLEDYRVEAQGNRTVAGVEGGEMGFTGVFRGKGFRYRFWVAVHEGILYELQMWSSLDRPAFPEPWTELLSGFVFLPGEA